MMRTIQLGCTLLGAMDVNGEYERLGIMTTRNLPVMDLPRLCQSTTMASSSTATPLRLNCWVLGEDSTRIFPVKVDHDENVGALKKAIKEEKKPAFDHIIADSLEIWNVSIPIHEDTNLQAQVKDLRLHERKPLWPLRGLLRIFRGLDQEALHVVVKAPSISEHRCLFLYVTLIDLQVLQRRPCSC